MTSMEKTGKTIEEAVALALSELEVGIDRIDYEVLEAPSRGFFGFIGTKLAKVRVTVKPIDPMKVAQDFLEKIFKRIEILIFPSSIKNKMQEGNSEDVFIDDLIIKLHDNDNRRIYNDLFLERIK